ncbi:hypothetical protein [Floridanema aerugineum]|uniref:Uncharacterized protein n=1 Tax=Floridaenema aerugineum BLCC-F46 TaxID=3153654 RepID=A0ABV4XHB7_9CYAN
MLSQYLTASSTSIFSIGRIRDVTGRSQFTMIQLIGGDSAIDLPWLKKLDNIKNSRFA